jgi:hypothetical protein
MQYLTFHFLRRFVAKYGHLNYLDYYFPQYKLQGKKHLAGLRFDDLEKTMRQKKGKTPIYKP